MLQMAEFALLPEESLELQAIEAESIGWIPLGQGAYLHHGACADDAADSVIEVVGIASAQMAGMNVVWLI
jgi:hypothetical protein